MAGKRQHYVPRLLQRGFLAKPLGSGDQTWLHRRGTCARQVGITNVGVETWFYSRKSTDGAPTLDDVITELEGDLAKEVRALRDTSTGQAIDSLTAARTVSHLVLRTAHFRNFITSVTTAAYKEFGALFSDTGQIRAMYGVDQPSFPNYVLEVIGEEAEKLASQGIPGSLSERVIAFLAREWSDQWIAQAATTSALFFSRLSDELSGMVRRAHGSILNRTSESDTWVEVMAEFEWHIEGGVDLILPDAVALAWEADGELRPILSSHADQIQGVVMPVSSTRLLVGRAPGDASIDLSQFNSQAAANSEAFFIGAKPLDDQGLSDLIGTALIGILEKKVAEAMRHAERKLVVPAHNPLHIAPDELGGDLSSFSVRLADFGDEALAQEIGATLSRIVGALARHLPLHDLDGFTIAVDYAAAVASLDRGDSTLPPVFSTAPTYAAGVAKIITVMRDGNPKEHIVIAANVAMAWLGQDKYAAELAFYTLVEIVVGAAYFARYATALTTALDLDATAHAFHGSVAEAPRKYWRARIAAFVHPAQGQAYADLVVDGLRCAAQMVSTERAAIPTDGNTDNAIRQAVECLSSVLDHAAGWLGHRDGLPEGQSFEGHDLPARLKELGLDRWIDLFGSDLAVCYDQQGNIDFNVVKTLSQHVERLLWSQGIFCWPVNNDVRCVVTDRPYVMPKPQWPENRD